MEEADKFLDRYVLGIGQPIFDHGFIRLVSIGGESIFETLKVPPEFDTDDLVPKYALVLERVK